MHDEQKTVKLCKLDNGDVVAYDAYCDDQNYHDNRNLRALGTGVIYSVNGVIQNSERRLYFFVVDAGQSGNNRAVKH